MSAFRYMTGELVLVGDVVKLGASEEGVVTTVVQADSSEWNDYGGVAITTNKGVPIRLEEINEDLVLVRRKA